MSLSKISTGVYEYRGFAISKLVFERRKFAFVNSGNSYSAPGEFLSTGYTKVSEWHIVPVGNRIEQLNQVSEYAVEDIQEQGYFTREEAKTAIDRYIKLRKL
jgi:hypothetical protein